MLPKGQRGPIPPTSGPAARRAVLRPPALFVPTPIPTPTHIPSCPHFPLLVTPPRLAKAPDCSFARRILTSHSHPTPPLSPTPPHPRPLPLFLSLPLHFPFSHSPRVEAPDCSWGERIPERAWCASGTSHRTSFTHVSSVLSRVFRRKLLHAVAEAALHQGVVQPQAESEPEHKGKQKYG